MAVQAYLITYIFEGLKKMTIK